MSKGKIISIIIAAGYIILGYAAGGGALAGRLLAFLIFPLACIWYGEYMGGMHLFKGPIVTTGDTPGCLVTFMGWVLLFVPIIAALISGWVN